MTQLETLLLGILMAASFDDTDDAVPFTVWTAFWDAVSPVWRYHAWRYAWVFDHTRGWNPVWNHAWDPPVGYA